jgi:heptosyltransferase-2
VTSTLVIQTAFLGDVVLTTGLLTALAERRGPVDVLVTPAAKPLLDTHPAVKDVLVYDKRGRDRGLGGLLRTGRRLAERRYQRAYLPHRSARTAILARLGHIPERIGFADGSLAWLHTRRVARPSAGHEAERLLALAEPRPGREAQVGIALTAEDRDTAYAWLARQGIGEGFVAMAPGSIWGTKRWPGFAELARKVGGRVVVIGGPQDHELASELVSAAPDRVASAVGMALRVSAALLERASVLVTNDSAPLHLASAVGTPVVAIFGPTVTEFGFGPRGGRAAVVERSGLPCRPCSPHGPDRCPLRHHHCMREIPPAAVLEALDALTR